MSLRNREINNQVVFLLAVVIVVSWVLILTSQSTLIGMIFLIVLGAVITRYWILAGRIIHIDSIGITVRFLWYRKTYLWTQVKTVRVFECKDAIGYRLPYTRGIEISKKIVSRPSWMQPMQFGFFFHPFSYIVIHFPPSEKPPIKLPPLYEVNPDRMFELMNTWGIRIDRAGL